MQTNETELDLELDDADASERAGQPKLVVVESTGVHTEAEIRSANEVLRQVKKAEQVRAA